MYIFKKKKNCRVMSKKQKLEKIKPSANKAKRERRK